VEVQDPRSSNGFPGDYVAPRNYFFAPRNRNEAPGSKIAPKAKLSFPALIEYDSGNYKIIDWSGVSPGNYVLAPGATSLS
jgi:hypothetical protein